MFQKHAPHIVAGVCKVPSHSHKFSFSLLSFDHFLLLLSLPLFLTLRWLFKSPNHKRKSEDFSHEIETRNIFKTGFVNREFNFAKFNRFRPKAQLNLCLTNLSGDKSGYVK